VSNLLIYSIPGFITLLVLEVLWTRKRLREGAAGMLGYEKRDTFASLTMGVGNVIISAFTTLGAIALWSWGYEHRVLSLGQPLLWWSWAVLFFAEDLCYYWFHRMHHEVRLLWAAHVNHHSSQFFNLSTALRQPWFTPITGPVFWLPLAFLGYPPAMILTAEAISLIYQFWIHTETVHKPARVAAEHALASSRASRQERRLPRSQSRRRAHRLGPIVRHVRARRRARPGALRPHPRSEHLQSPAHRGPRIHCHRA
jgi:sterol desaturase/sphingolipid hydroxylase (fatty acid hydroxylase superfamily)